MPFATGVFNTGFNPAELNTRSFADTLLRLFPDGAAPLFALTGRLTKKTAKASTHGYFTKTMTFGSFQVTPAVASTTTQQLVGLSTTGLMPKMVLHNVTTREQMRILTVDSATQITVQRGWGRVAAANIANNEVLLCVGTAFEQASSRPTPRGMTTVYVPNYTQIFRNAWAVSDTARASYTEIGIENITENRKDCMLLHSTDIEAAIIFGQPKMDTSGSQPVHSTQGVIDAVSQYAAANINPAGGTTTWTQLITYLEPMWSVSHDMGNTKTRVAFVGKTAMKVMNDLTRINNMMQIQQSETTFGMQYNAFQFYKGRINLIEHPLFNGFPGLAGMMLVLDLSAFGLAYLNGRDTRSEDYGGTGKNNANGVDAEGGSLTSEFATELMNPAGCGLITGLTAAAAG